VREILVASLQSDLVTRHERRSLAWNWRATANILRATVHG